MVFLAGSATATAQTTVFAAASMSEAMRSLASAYSETGGEPIRFNFAATGSLARQIEAGAPADLFVSANSKWMDYLAEKGLVAKATRFNLAGNTLVMVAPKGAHLSFGKNIGGRLAVGDFGSVPAGRYAEEALEHLGWLDALRPKLVMASNVRTVLMYVERGEVAVGIVYASDAKASAKVEIVGAFSPDSHRPVVYPVAACSQKQEGLRFLEFLKTTQARAVLDRHGFAAPATPSDHPHASN